MSRFLSCLSLVAAALVGLPASAWAQDWNVTGGARREGPPRNYGNLRAGGSAGAGNGRVEICLELEPIRRLTFESCGTGSGFLHHDPDPEIAHFRGKWQLGAWRVGASTWLQAHAGLGFAELQIGDDDPGFDFTGTGRLGNETAGPETGLFLRALIPAAADFELILELHATAAWFAHAPDLVQPQSRFQPTLGLSLGFGF